MRGVNHEGLKTRKTNDLVAQLANSRTHVNVRKYIGHHQRLQKALDAYDTRHASVEFRRKALLAQKKHNYQLEYDRIRGLLGNAKLIPMTTVVQLRKREAQLKDLGAKAINGIQD